MFYSSKHDKNTLIVLSGSSGQSFRHPRTIVPATSDMLSGALGQHVRVFGNTVKGIILNL